MGGQIHRGKIDRLAGKAARRDVDACRVDPRGAVQVETVGNDQALPGERIDGRNRSHAPACERQLPRGGHGASGVDPRPGKVICGARARTVPAEIDRPERGPERAALNDARSVDVQLSARRERKLSRARTDDGYRAAFGHPAGQIIVGGDRELARRGRINLPGPQGDRAGDIESAITADIASVRDEGGAPDVLQ